MGGFRLHELLRARDTRRLVVHRVLLGRSRRGDRARGLGDLLRLRLLHGRLLLHCNRVFIFLLYSFPH